MRRATFLDRDGVLIRSAVHDGKPIAIQDPDAIEILPGVVEACRMLSAAGHLLVMVTNQPDIGRGLVGEAIVKEANGRLQDILSLDMVRVCPHVDSDYCSCRKPEPGMLSEAAEKLDIDLVRSFMVGDRWRDVAAGRRAGCSTILVDWGHGEAQIEAPDLVVSSLLEAVPWIIAR